MSNFKLDNVLILRCLEIIFAEKKYKS